MRFSQTQKNSPFSED
jgi:hypothetical protein